MPVPRQGRKRQTISVLLGSNFGTHAGRRLLGATAKSPPPLAVAAYGMRVSKPVTDAVMCGHVLEKREDSACPARAPQNYQCLSIRGAKRAVETSGRFLEPGEPLEAERKSSPSEMAIDQVKSNDALARNTQRRAGSEE